MFSALTGINNTLQVPTRTLGSQPAPPGVLPPQQPLPGRSDGQVRFVIKAQLITPHSVLEASVIIRRSCAALRRSTSFRIGLIHRIWLFIGIALLKSHLQKQWERGMAYKSVTLSCPSRKD